LLADSDIMVNPSLRTSAITLESQLESIDWGACDTALRLGYLGDLTFLLDGAHDKFHHLKRLGAIKAGLTTTHESIPSLEVQALFTKVTRMPKGLKGLKAMDVARFYNTFFESSIAVQEMADYVRENVTLLVTRRRYDGHKVVEIAIVGALTFSKPCSNVPCYLAYLGVSNGNGTLPSLQDKDVHVLPDDLAPTSGYQGHGLGSLLVIIHDRILSSRAYQKVTLSPHAFIHINASNSGAKVGWERQGYCTIPEATTRDGSNPLELYAVMAHSMVEMKVFSIPHNDTDNCKAMYREATVTVVVNPKHRKAKRFKAPPAPADDYWYEKYTPGDITKGYIAPNAPSTKDYSLSAHEIKAKYASIGREAGPAPPSFIVEMAAARKELRQSRDPVLLWTDQDFINFACLQDPNRLMEVDKQSLLMKDGENLVRMRVDSFLLPRGFVLEDVALDISKLKKSSQTIKCNWNWLKSELIPELRTIVEEALFGLGCITGIGLDAHSSHVGHRDVSTMAVFHGVQSHEHHFIAPPVSHKLVTLPLNEYTHKGKTNGRLRHKVAHQLQGYAKQNENFHEHVVSLGITAKPPPLPKGRWQIARLKWIPTDDPGANDAIKGKRGYFQGAYVVPGTTWFSIVSLKDDWVKPEFDPKLLKEVINQGVLGLRPSHKFIPIPPGSSKNQALPPSTLLHYLRNSRFQQGSQSTCLLDCLCSAAYDLGCIQNVETLRAHPGCPTLHQANTLIWNDFGTLVNKHFKSVGLQVFNHTKSHFVKDFLGFDDSFVIIATLRGSDGMAGQHAVAIYNNGIYDANCPFVLKKQQESLDWCCGDGDVTCIGIERSVQLLPIRHKELTPELRFVFQTRNKFECNVRGWVAGTKKKRVMVQFADGESRSVTKDELDMFARLD
jgi:hypothetical protein